MCVCCIDGDKLCALSVLFVFVSLVDKSANDLVNLSGALVFVLLFATLIMGFIAYLTVESRRQARPMSRSYRHICVSKVSGHILPRNIVELHKRKAL